MMSEELARLEAEVRALRYVIEDVRELIVGYMDIVDGGVETGPLPNKAMRAVHLIDEALAR